MHSHTATSTLGFFESTNPGGGGARSYGEWRRDRGSGVVPIMAAVAGAAVEARPAGAAPASAMPGRGGAPRRQRSVSAPFAAGLALLAGLGLYGLTCAPGVQGGDSGEFQFVAYILGIPHPPGYPLYALVGRLWTLVLPFGEVAYRMNLLSAVFAAATLAAAAWANATAYGRGTAGLGAAAA